MITLLPQINIDFLNGIPHSIILDGIQYTWTWIGSYLFTTATDGTCFSLHEYLGQVVEQVCNLKDISILLTVI